MLRRGPQVIKIVEENKTNDRGATVLYCDLLKLLIKLDNLIIIYIGMKDRELHDFLPNIKRYISPPNPIIDKTDTPFEPPLDLNSDEDTQQSTEIYTLATAYSLTNLIFLKWKNRETERNGTSYFASNFLQPQDKEKLNYQGHVVEDSLIFNSNIESGNLLAVYKMGQDQYDLIMQNDVNSSGYTQWFNFTVSNGNKRGTVKFNIVNFYKKQSLFKHGMKPLTRSLVHDKHWNRRCYQVEYFLNEIRMEGRKRKYYKTLSFSYDFIYQNDTVQFAYTYPYTYETFNSWIKGFSSSKLRVKYLGATTLKKIITMFHISSEYQDERVPKRAIVILGRQHAGETPSSFVIESIVQQLLGSSQQVQMLLQKFQFYIFPMVNVDGVVLGNYRCNMAGYDLNRSWDQQVNKSITQIFYIKSELKKIMRRTAIEMVLDLHGHSTKMNSFFYGNTFGRHNMIFPLFISKIQPMVDLSSCCFSDEDKDKSKTARVILGNMIRETGSAYTYEISLFGYTKNNKMLPFLPEHFQEMGRSLLAAMSKCQIEICKEERGLKESLFLKELRRQIKKVENRLVKNQAGSDDEAKKTTLIEEGAKTIKSYRKKDNSSLNQKRKQERSKQVMERCAQTEDAFEVQEYRIAVGFNSRVGKWGQERQRAFKLQKRRDSLSSYKIKSGADSYKDFLMNNLRIFGQTCSIENSSMGSKNLELLSLREYEMQTTYTFKPLKDKPTKMEVPTSSVIMGFYNTAIRKALTKEKTTFRSNKSKSSKSGLDLNVEGLFKFSHPK